MPEKDDWSLFLETGLPQAYTYLKERERRNATEQRKEKGPGRTDEWVRR